MIDTDKILMVAGPTEMEADVRAAGSMKMVYNRTPEFSAFMQGVEDKLKKLFRTKSDVFVISSSGTGAMEAAVTNVISRGDEVVVLSGGTFGHRWYEIADRYGADCRVLSVPRGHSASAEEIAAKMTEKTKVVFVTANETSTGVTIDLKAVGAMVRKTKAVLVVDAVSSLGADPIEMDEWGCDVVITSSQKALALPPGLSFMAVGEKAWPLIERSDIPKFYFDLKMYRDNIKRGQTPFTPPISLLYQLDVRLERMMEKGCDRVVEEQAEKSKLLRDGLKALNLKAIGERPSAGVVGVLFPEEIDASKVVEMVRREYSIEITPSPGDDRVRIARIGMFGNISRKEIERLLSALGKVMSSDYVKATSAEGKG